MACNGTANFTFPSPVCVGTPVTFTNASTGGASSYVWDWDDSTPNTTTTNTDPVTHTFTAPGTYIIKMERFFSNGCNDDITRTITIVNNPPPAPTFTFAPNNTCSQNPISFTNTTASTAGLTFTWNFGDPASGTNNTATGNTPKHMFTATGSGTTTYTVTLTSTNTAGCTSSSTQSVTVSNRPDASLTDQNLFSPFNNCSFASSTNQIYDITVENTSSTLAANANYTINWGDGTPNFTGATFTTAAHTYAALGIYNVLLTVTGTNGCVDTASYKVINLSNPSVGLTGPGNTSGCAPQTYQFTLSPDLTNAAYTSYTFDFGDGSPTVTWQPPITTTVISHTYTKTSCGQPGNQFTVKVSAKNACDSTQATVNAIKISTRPQAEFSFSPEPGCVNVPVTFTNLSVPGCYISGSSTNTTTQYTWNFGDGSANVVTSSAAAQAHTYTLTGTYTVTLTAANPCGSTTHTEIVPIIGPPTAAFTNSIPGCAPAIVTTDNTSTLDSLDFNWTVSPGGWTFANGTDATSFEPQFQFNAAGTYTITLTVTNPCGVSTATSIITIKSVPSISLGAISNTCGQASVTPSVSYSAGGGTISAYSWNLAGGTPATSSLENPTNIIYNTPGTYTITATATNECGSGNASQSFIVSTLPAAAAGTDKTICPGQSAAIGSPAVADNSYSWSSIPAGFGSGQPDPTVSPLSTTDYVVTVTNAAGCVNTDTIKVTVTPPPAVSAGSPRTVCANAAPFNLTGHSPAGGTWSGTGVTPAGSFNAATAGVGTHTLTYTYSAGAGGCSNSATVNITVEALPVVEAGNNQTLCNQPGTVTLTGNSPAGGTWSGTGVTAGGVFNASTAGVGSHLLTYTFTTPANCSAFDTIRINVVDPTPAAAGPNNTFCLNDAAITLTGFSPAGGTWSGPGITNPSGTFSPAAAGAGTHTLTYTFGSGTCQTTDQRTVVVNPLPVVNAGAAQSACIDAGIITLAGFSPAGGTWSGTGVTPAGDFDPSIAGAGTHTLTYSYTDPATNCAASATKSITVNPLPVVNAGTGFIVCNQPVTVTLTGQSPAGGTWSGPGVSAAGGFDPSTAGNGTHDLTYAFTDANGCSKSDTIKMTVVSPATAQAGVSDTVCVNAPPFTLTGFSPAGGTWSGTGITAASGTFDPSAAGAGTHTVTYTYGTGTCQTTDQKTVVVDPLPAINPGTATATCVNSPPFDLTGFSPAGGTWSGTGITIGAQGTFDPGAAGIGTHTLTYSYTDPVTGCSNTAALSQVVNDLPAVAAGTGFIVCDQPIPVTLTGFSPAGGTWSGAGVNAAGSFNPSTAGVGTHVLTYTFSSGVGCVNTDTIRMTVVPPAVADAGSDDTFCLNAGTITLGGFSPAGGTWTGTGITDPSGIFDPAVAGPGTHQLTYSYGAGTCLTTDTREIIVNPLPVIDPGVNDTACISAAPFSFGGYTPAGGTWTGTGITSGAGTFDPQAAGAGMHTLTYTYTDPVTGCINTAARTAYVDPLPVPAFTNIPQACEDIPVTFTNSTTGAATYSWSFGDGGASAQQEPSYAYPDTGIFTIKLIAFTQYGCSDSVTSSIQVYKVPEVSFVMTPDSGCGPLTVSFDNHSKGELVTYLWDLGNGQTSTLFNPPPVTYEPGIYDTTYYVTLSVTNFCGTIVYTDSVLVLPPPTALFGTNVNEGCSPLTLLFNNQTIGSGSDYFWDFGDGTTSTVVQAFNHTFYTGTEDTTYIITLIASNQCGADTIQHSVLVHPNTVTAFFNTDATTGCAPLTVNFTNYSSGGSNITWSFGDGNIANVPDPTHTFTAAGTYTVYQYVNNGCSYDTTSIQVTVYPAAGLSFTAAPTTVCVDQPITFTNTSTNSSGYEWSFGDSATSTLTSPVHAYDLAGTYTVILSGTSTTWDCPASVTSTVTVLSLPAVQFAPDVTFGCVPLTIAFQNNTSNASFYEWRFGDGNTSAGASPSHTFTSPGIYQVKLVARNSNCSDSMTVQVEVYPEPSAAFTLSSPYSCTAPATVTLTNNSTGATGYTWDLGNGQTSALNDPTVTFNDYGIYNIILEAVNAFGCKDSAVFTFGVYETPVVAFTPSTQVGCEDLAVTFTNQTQSGNIYYWTFGDGDTSSFATPTAVYETPGTYTVTLVAVNRETCADTLQMTGNILVHPSPVASFTYEQKYTEDGTPNGSIEFVNTTSGGVTYDWSFGDGLGSEEVHPSHQYSIDGDYSVRLIAENQHQCSDTSTQVINVEYFQGLHVPNAFIPASLFPDLQTFLPKGKNLKEYHIQVFNTWGSLLWESTAIDAYGSPAEGWDGSFNGVPCPQDVYVWKVRASFENGSIWKGKRYPGGEIRNTGTISLIR